MNTRKKQYAAMGLLISLCFVFWIILESSAWARAGGGGSSGSRGSRSFSTPSAPSTSSPSRPYSSPGSTPAPGAFPGAANQPSSGMFSRSPFLQGLAGGVAGGFLGNMLFGGSGHASPMGGGGGGGIGLFDIVILGLLGYFGFKFYRRWQQQKGDTPSFYGDVLPPRTESSHGTLPSDPYYANPAGGAALPYDELERGLEQIRRIDPNFNEDTFKELVQDLFFRIQAGWMNRSLEGIDNLLTAEMSEFFKSEFEKMKQQGRSNRLENIAVRKVELAEAWQEAGKDYVTVLFTANLLDYTVDDNTGQVIQGDKLNPVKFQEFWTYCRDVGGSRWQLSAINQPGESTTRH